MVRKKGPKEQKGKSLWGKVNQVPKQNRAHIHELLKSFQASDEPVLTFEASQSKLDRALVHLLCTKMGMKSKSKGSGNQRCVSVFKTPGKEPKNKIFGKQNNVTGKQKKQSNENLSCLTLSEQSQMILQDLFSRYPPEDEEHGTRLAQKNRSKAGRKRGDSMFSAPLISKEDITKKVELLSSKLKMDARFRKTFEGRSKLPIAAFSEVIRSTVDSNQVVLISGETGCGKTTQVPQMLLDHLWSRGEVGKIVCTQPRRISAMSVADRISQERGQTTGDDVGYKIRLESKGNRNSSIVFCTNGILLRVLVSGGTSLSSSSSKRGEELSGITHIIVDEIHERDRHSDFMLTVIRDLLPLYPHLRLILMSATLDAERFAQYFGGCPIIRVPGFTFPVTAFYLEDALSILKASNHRDSSKQDTPNNLSKQEKAALDEAIHLAWSNDEFDLLMDLVSSEGSPKVYNYQHSSTGLTPLMVFAGKGRVGDVCMLLSVGANHGLKNKDGMTALALAERENQGEAAEVLKGHVCSSLCDPSEHQTLLDKYLAEVDPDLIDVMLIERLLKKICQDSKDGAIIVFLPGWDDINKIRKRLLENSFFKDPSNFLIISLHSMVPPAEQKKVFDRPRRGCRKIVLSTNIAESSITIDDVVYVIDSGRMKEKSYDPFSNVSTLQTSWISKASAKQREGRAGRCQPGICYHLFSKFRAASLPDFQVPEIRRIPIDELCLQVKLLDPNCKIESFLLKTMDPPYPESIANAIGALEELGALSPGEQLTELGKTLGRLPVHPLISKMLLFGVLMNCLDPALTIACAADYRSPFMLPISPDEKKKANDRKVELGSVYGGFSDQLAVVAAFDCWRKAKDKGKAANFCSDYHLSVGTMKMLSSMRKQLHEELIRHGLVPEDVSTCNRNASDPGIITAVLVASMYPNVGKVLPPKDDKRGVIQTSDGAKVRLNNFSLCAKVMSTKYDVCPLVVYDEVTRGDMGMRIMSCTVVGPLPLVLLATEIAVASPDDDTDGGNNKDGKNDTENKNDDTENKTDDGDGMDIDEVNGRKIMSVPDNPVIIAMDRWLHLKSTAIDVAQIYCLKERLSAAIIFKVSNPRKSLPPALEASMQAVARVLSCDGLSGMPLLSPDISKAKTKKGNHNNAEESVAKHQYL
ncbi:DExH-box ATP-dependent RNA helicase DExH6 [Linum grandiflorum]